MNRPKISNEIRAGRAQAALAAYKEVQGDPNNIRDLLTDLLHWCDRNNYEFDIELDMAREHHEAEKEEERNKPLRRGIWTSDALVFCVDCFVEDRQEIQRMPTHFFRYEHPEFERCRCDGCSRDVWLRADVADLSLLRDGIIEADLGIDAGLQQIGGTEPALYVWVDGAARDAMTPYVAIGEGAATGDLIGYQVVFFPQGEGGPETTLAENALASDMPQLLDVLLT